MRALVLSGGGAKGAYEVGAIYHLLHDRHIHYDILAGTSVGALNSGFLSQFPKGSEAEAAQGLKDLWFSLDTPKIYRKWYHGFLWLLPAFWRPSVFCTAPLRGLVTCTLHLDKVKASGKLLRVGATSLTTGARRIWTEQSPDLASGIMASSAFPGAFEPVTIGDEVYLDDGIREITPIEDAVKAGATRLDVIGVDSAELDPHFTMTSVVAGAPRVLQTMLHEIDVWDYKGAELYNHIIELTNLLPPDKVPAHIQKLVSGKKFVTLNDLRPVAELSSPLDFSPASIRLSFDRGYEDAKKLAW